MLKGSPYLPGGRPTLSSIKRNSQAALPSEKPMFTSAYAPSPPETSCLPPARSEERQWKVRQRQ